MGLFTPRMNTVFASRWKAVWWCASILATAYCTVQGLPSDKDEAQSVVKMVKGHKGKEHEAAKNPWALDKPAAH